MPPPRKPPSVPARDRQQLLESLGRMLSAGLTAAQAAATLESGEGAATSLRTLRMQLEDGKSVASALRRAKLVSPLEHTLLDHAEQAGRVDAALIRMAARDTQRINSSRQMRNKLIAPAAIIIVGLLVSPLPKLVAGELSTGGYAARALLPLLVIAVLVVVIRRLLPRARGRWREALPIIGPVMRDRARLESLVSLHALLDAGVPALDALVAMRDDYPLADTAHECLHRGDSVAAALRDAGFIDAQHGYPRVDAGEQAGRLVDALGRHLSDSEERQASREGLLAEWFPRLVYVAAAGFAAWSMIGGSIGQ